MTSHAAESCRKYVLAVLLVVVSRVIEDKKTLTLPDGTVLTEGVIMYH